MFLNIFRLFLLHAVVEQTDVSSTQLVRTAKNLIKMCLQDPNQTTEINKNHIKKTCTVGVWVTPTTSMM